MFFFFFYVPECELCNKPTETISRIFCPECFEKTKGLAYTGNADAQMLVGRYYSCAAEDDETLAKKAVLYYAMSADQGNMYAQRFLGACFMDGFGVEKNYGEAIKWYKKSARQGYEPAQHALDVLMLAQNNFRKKAIPKSHQ